MEVQAMISRVFIPCVRRFNPRCTCLIAIIIHSAAGSCRGKSQVNFDMVSVDRNPRLGGVLSYLILSDQ